MLFAAYDEQLWTALMNGEAWSDAALGLGSADAVAGTSGHIRSPPAPGASPVGWPRGGSAPGFMAWRWRTMSKLFPDCFQVACGSLWSFKLPGPFAEAEALSHSVSLGGVRVYNTETLGLHCAWSLPRKLPQIRPAPTACSTSRALSRLGPV